MVSKRRGAPAPAKDTSVIARLIDPVIEYTVRAPRLIDSIASPLAVSSAEVDIDGRFSIALPAMKTIIFAVAVTTLYDNKRKPIWPLAFVWAIPTSPRPRDLHLFPGSQLDPGCQD
jgi:hypothetical protein